MKTIFLSCGHNMARNIRNILVKDVGAVDPTNKENTEYRWVRTIANKVEREWSGADKLVVVPEGLSLVDRIKYINARAIDGDVCIELHMNAGGGNGTETLYYAGSETARNKADVFNTRISKGLGTTNRGAKPDTISRFGSLGFIRDTKPLALLVELGFIDNAGDRDRVWTGAKVVAEAIKKI